MLLHGQNNDCTEKQHDRKVCTQIRTVIFFKFDTNLRAVSYNVLNFCMGISNVTKIVP